MESSSNQIQESSTHFPSEIKNLENQTPPSQLLQTGLSPQTPQLRHSLSRKQPRTKVVVSPPPSSFIFSPSPETLALIEDGSYYNVPSKWRPDNKVCSRDLYLSRNSLLKKLIHQRILYRALLPIVEKNLDEGEDTGGIEVLGSPIDYWVTVPIQTPTRLEIADPPALKDVSLNETEGISIAFATGAEKPYGYGLNRLTGYGPEPDFSGIPFQWVTNTTGTKFLDRDAIISHDFKRIHGFVHCQNCGEILCLGYLVPTRIDMVDLESEKISRYGDKLLRNSPIGCRCQNSNNGKVYPGRHFISDDLNKINWMFLFLGYGIGNCTIDQLKYYCIQRKLPILDNKNQILATVFNDLCLQIKKRTFQD